MFELVRKTIEPPYNSRDLYSIFVALVLMLLIPITVIGSTKTYNFQSAAANFDTTQAMQISITSPKNTATTSGLTDITVSANNSSDSISSINVYVDHQLLAKIENPANDSKFLTKVSWDTTKLPDGNHILSASAFDSQGRGKSAPSIQVSTANPDTTPPSVNFTNINDGSYLTGNSVLIKAEASDNNGVSLVEMRLDGQLVKKFSKLPYEALVDLTNIEPGNHILTARAIDFSGNKGQTKLEFYRGVKSSQANLQ